MSEIDEDGPSRSWPLRVYGDAYDAFSEAIEFVTSEGRDVDVSAIVQAVGESLSQGGLDLSDQLVIRLAACSVLGVTPAAPRSSLVHSIGCALDYYCSHQWSPRINMVVYDVFMVTCSVAAEGGYLNEVADMVEKYFAAANGRHFSNCMDMSASWFQRDADEFGVHLPEGFFIINLDEAGSSGSR